MNQSVCSRCGRNNHNEDECLSVGDLTESVNLYSTLLPKEKNRMQIIINFIKNLGSTIKKVLEVPPSA